MAGLGRTIPALPVRDVDAAVAHYRERFGFAAVHQDDEFAVIVRDDAELYLWGASDEDWRSRADLAARSGRQPDHVLPARFGLGAQAAVTRQ